MMISISELVWDVEVVVWMCGNSDRLLYSVMEPLAMILAFNDTGRKLSEVRLRIDLHRIAEMLSLYRVKLVVEIRLTAPRGWT
jgi:hypothetical protein